ncbi:MAG: Crp/Fnr family transcriptional regulator [Anaerolineales bacterium]
MALKSVEALSSVPLFSELDANVLDVVRHAAAPQYCAAREMVFLQGDPCAGLYIVQEGWLKGIITSPAGREQIIRLLGPGDVFNEIGLLTDGRNLVTVQALEDSTLWVIERETMLRLMDEHPRLCRAITRNLAERVLHLMKLVEDLSMRTVKSRMARLLLENAVEGVINRRRWMTQTEMAARLGTVLDVVNRTLNSLENDGLIIFERYKIQILDCKLLEELANLED